MVSKNWKLRPKASVKAIFLITILLGAVLTLAACSNTTYTTSTTTPSSAGVTPTAGAKLTLPNRGDSVGSYTCAYAASSTTAISGQVFLIGEPLADWPTSSWPINYPVPQSGSVMVIFDPDGAREQWLQTQSGNVWQLNNTENQLGSQVDILYIAPGYLWVKFENVRIPEGSVTFLPDVTLTPIVWEFIFYPENQ